MALINTGVIGTLYNAWRTTAIMMQNTALNMKDMTALDKTQRTDVENQIITIHTHSYLVEILAMDVGAVLLCVHVVAQPQPHVRLRGSARVIPSIQNRRGVLGPRTPFRYLEYQPSVSTVFASWAFCSYENGHWQIFGIVLNYFYFLNCLNWALHGTSHVMLYRGFPPPMRPIFWIFSIVCKFRHTDAMQTF